MKTVNFSRFGLFTMVAITLMPFLSSGQKKEVDKIAQSTEVLKEFEKMKDKIPSSLFKQTQGIIVIPKMLNIGLGIGGKRGKGIVVTRLANGKWSDPSFITLTGGSIGFQAGVQSVDLVLLFKHRSNLMKLDKGSFTLGGDMSVTAGPLGRNATASTDYKLEAEIYSYSRSRGLFGGISINGAVLAIDQKENSSYYHSNESAATILNHNSGKAPALQTSLSYLN